MEKCFDEKKIAKLTGTAVQDDETFKIVELKSEQPYGNSTA